ncbi:MAG: hypothetical protein HYY32_07420 [Chloroflexi bacterium]|nr:hypothetical protein [Chloroflexota bacterium]
MNKRGSPTLRVVVASETPEVRDQITRVVEREPGVRVVGQAHNSIEAMTKAKDLRPEVTVVDPYLPYLFGLDDVPLSRMSGLDTATGVTGELPGAMAVLLSNPNPALRERGPEAVAHLGRYSGDFWVPLRLRDLQAEANPKDRVVFADVWAEETQASHSKAMELSYQLVVWGGLSLVAGFALMLTWIMVFIGLPLAGGGLVAILLGLVIKGVASRFSSPIPRAETTEE